MDAFQLFSQRSRNLFMAVGAALASLLAALVISGWLTSTTVLVQLHPSFVPMQFNTALAFLLCAAAIAFRLVNESRICLAAAGLVTLLAAMTLAQYFFAADFGIDELFIEHYVTVQTSHPGRMAPNTALGFVLVGLALILMATRRKRVRHSLAPQILAALAAAMGLAAAFGYLVGVETVYGWGTWTRMAPHTAVGFLLVGTVTFVGAWRSESRTDEAKSFVLLPVSIGAAAVLLVLWQGLVAEGDIRIRNTVSNQVLLLESSIERQLAEQLNALERMAGRWESQERIWQEAWESDARAYLADYGDLETLAWIDQGMGLNWQVGRLSRSEWAAENTASHVASRLAAGRGASATVFPADDVIRSHNGIAAFFPLRRNGQADGFLLAILSMDALTNSMRESLSGYGFAVRSRDSFIFGTAAGANIDEQWSQTGTLEIADAQWSLQVWPSPSALSELRFSSSLVTAVLGSALVAACLLLLSLHLAYTGHSKAQRLALANQKLADVQAELQRLALFDSLTELGNRNLFHEQLDSMITTAARNRRGFGVLVMDLNGFKAVNDQFGHFAGDDVLREFSRRLTTSLRESDRKFRIGGDEFAVLTGSGTDSDNLRIVAEKILDVMQRPVEAAGAQHIIGVSIGAAVYADRTEDRQTLIRRADAAMYEAKTGDCPFVLASDLGATTIMKSLRLRKQAAGSKSG